MTMFIARLAMRVHKSHCRCCCCCCWSSEKQMYLVVETRASISLCDAIGLTLPIPASAFSYSTRKINLRSLHGSAVIDFAILYRLPNLFRNAYAFL